MTSSPKSRPLLEALVGGPHRRGVLIAPIHELEEEHRTGVVDGQIADLVHDEQRGMGEDSQALRQSSGRLRFFQRGDEVDEDPCGSPLL
jgi:hypothetical protein